MNLLVRLIWKTIPKEQRKYFLSHFRAHDQKALSKLLNNRASFPEGSNRIIFINVPKVASTSLNVALAGGEMHTHLPLKYFESLDKKRFDEHFKIAFVRNPWARAVSAYQGLKRGGGVNVRDSTWVKLVNKFESFDQFVDLWMNEENIFKQIHFVPQHYFLEDEHGDVAVDFLGRFENINADFEFLKEKFNLPVELMKSNASSGGDYRELYTDSSRNKIALLYKEDIEKFGYSFE